MCRPESPAFRPLSVLAVVVCCAAGCVVSPPGENVEYGDPLDGIGTRAAGSADYSQAVLGLMHSENVAKALSVVEDAQRKIKSIRMKVNTAALEDADPGYIPGELNGLLAKRFKEVVAVGSVAEAQRQGVDFVMILDLRIQFGARSGEQTSVFVGGIMVDLSGEPLDEIEGTGAVTIGYPAHTYEFKAASSQALAQFASRLDSADKLAAAIGRRPSAPAPVGGLRSGRGFAVVIGIAEYEHSGSAGFDNLLYADDDASAFAGELRRQGWQDSHIKLLINEEATERNVRIALESWLTKASPNDLVVLYWAGHGFPDPEDPERVYFACYDTDARVPATGYRMDRVRAALEERAVRNVVVLVDTCHAGKLVTRGNRDLSTCSVVPEIDKMRRQQSVPKGWIFMVGAETDRQSVEHSSWSNGAFTHCLLKGLSGSADGFQSIGPQDGVVTMGELRAYLSTTMPEETQKILGVAKHPLITTGTADPDIWDLSLKF